MEFIHFEELNKNENDVDFTVEEEVSDDLNSNTIDLTKLHALLKAHYKMPLFKVTESLKIATILIL